MNTLASALPNAIVQTWPPFVLVAGLLLVGVVASTDGLFQAVGTWLARLPGGGITLFISLMALVAVTTVVLNLDTSVVFLTPIVLHSARQRGIDETAFAYGAVFMSNSASLLLPGSNLTNLLVMAERHQSGTAFASAMFPAWVAAVVVTTGVLLLWRRRDLRQTGSPVDGSVHFEVGLGLAGVIAAAALVLSLSDPAPPVLALGLVLAIGQMRRSRLGWREALKAASVVPLSGLFVIAVGLGTLARLWGAPGRLMASAGPWATAWIGAGVASLVNNLPAAVMLSSRPPAHPHALLVGLDLGPNLVVTGALSAILWMRVARSEGANVSAGRYSKIGLILVPVSMVAALVSVQLFVPGA